MIKLKEDMDLYINQIDPITGFMEFDCCKWLYETAQQFTSWTEIGVFRGRSAYCVAMGLKSGGTLNLLDINNLEQWNENNGAGKTLEKIRKIRPDLELNTYKCESIKPDDFPSTEVVFLDGNHSYSYMLLDIEVWENRCTRLLAGHDFEGKESLGVKQAVWDALGNDGMEAEGTSMIWCYWK